MFVLLLFTVQCIDEYQVHLAARSIFHVLGHDYCIVTALSEYTSLVLYICTSRVYWYDIYTRPVRLTVPIVRAACCSGSILVYVH